MGENGFFEALNYYDGLESIVGELPTLARTSAHLSLNPGLLQENLATSTFVVYDGRGHFKVTDGRGRNQVLEYLKKYYDQNGKKDGLSVEIGDSFYDSVPGYEFNLELEKKAGTVRKLLSGGEAGRNPVLLSLFDGKKIEMELFVATVYGNGFNNGIMLDIYTTSETPRLTFVETQPVLESYQIVTPHWFGSGKVFAGKKKSFVERRMPALASLV